MTKSPSHFESRLACAALVAAAALAAPFAAGSSAADATGAAPSPDLAALAAEVRAAETAFASSMAHRDLEAFAAHVAEDAIFFGETKTHVGKAAVVEVWKPLFREPRPPFSWAPEQVEVLASGTLAHSSGPVLSSQGVRIGTFNSVWRREPDGRWLVVFDKGCDVCPPRAAANAPAPREDAPPVDPTPAPDSAPAPDPSPEPKGND